MNIKIDSEKGEKRRRKKYLIKKMQIKYSVMITAVMIILISASQLYTYKTLQMILPQILSTEIGNKISALQANLLIIGVLYIIIIAIMAVYVMHRIVGPIFRIMKDAEYLSITPDLSFRFRVRMGDEFKGLADSLNKMMKNFEDTYGR